MVRSLFLAVIGVLLHAALVLTQPSGPQFHVDPNTRHFVDTLGRVRIFHGVNIVYKVPPYYPQSSTFDPVSSLTDEDIDDLSAWGFNMVRLGVMWPGTMPTADGVNQTYIDEMVAIVNRLGAKGIYTLVDLHQDLFARKFCGEGAPEWAVQPEGKTVKFPFPLPVKLPINETGYPSIEDCLKAKFSLFYFTDQVGASFQALYDNYQGVQDGIITHWKAVATAFQSNPFVLGYEIINEPWPGNIYADRKLILDPAYADTKNLMPFYNNVASAIRAIDPERIIFFEPVVTTSVTSQLAGFTQVPGGADYNNRSVLSYHVYCPITSANGDPVNGLVCDLAQSFDFDNYQKDIIKTGGGGFLTEFGAVSTDAKGQAEIEWVATQSDKYLQSWAYWQFKSYYDYTTASGPSESFYSANGTLETGKVRTLARTYPTAIAGTPTLIKFDPSTAVFTLQYNASATQGIDTQIIFCTEYYYPNGITVTLDPVDDLSASSNGNIVSVFHTANITAGMRVTISLAPKSAGEDGVSYRRTKVPIDVPENPEMDIVKKLV